MRPLLLGLLLFLSARSYAQHCPWDCAGLLLIQTDAPKDQLQFMAPALVDEQKNVIIDTIYGTGSSTYDTVNLMRYDDFINYRIQRMVIHSWYGFDTVYHFAENMVIGKFNLCRYSGKKVFIRYTDPANSSGGYRYIEVPGANRISPHDFSSLINEGKTEEIKELIKSQLLHISW